MNPKQTKKKTHPSILQCCALVLLQLSIIVQRIAAMAIARGSGRHCPKKEGFVPRARRVSATIRYLWWHSHNFISRRTSNHTVTRTAGGAINAGRALMAAGAGLLKKVRTKKIAAVLAAILLLSTSSAAFGQDEATYTYDGLGRLVKVTFTDGTTIKYTYDANGNRTSTLVCCSDEKKFTTGDAISDFLVAGLIATTPTALSSRSDSSLKAPNSISLSDDGLLWINTTKDLGSGQTAYDIVAFDSEPNRNFILLIDKKSGTLFLSDYQI